MSNKFNKRSFLIGLGVGIMIGAALLQLFQTGQSNQEQRGRASSPQQAEQGQPTPQTGDENMPTETSGEDEPGDEDQSLMKQTSSETANTPDESAAAAVEGEEGNVGKEATVASELVVRIEPGFNLTETAELLASSKAIDNAGAFIKEMKKQRKVVRAGYFLFAEGTNIEEAVKIVTGEPLSPEVAEQLLQGSAQ